MSELCRKKAIPRLRDALLAWYSAHARELPWRQTSDPYAIWVSEIMLQQTQVATVIDYYHRFLAAFPNVAALAGADEQEVLGLWSGLGYYRRARQMHAAAKRIVQEFGDFPTLFEDIISLPGIGRYTAGAIASFAFDQRAPIVEANTQRLFARLLKLQDDPRSSASQQKLWQFAESLLPDSGQPGSGKINQATMELGSQLCTPREPDCKACPISTLCPTFASGLQHAIPLAAPKLVVTEMTHIALVIEHRGRYLLRQNAANQWWQGLWDFPRLDVTGAFVNQRRTARQQLLDQREWLGAEMARVHGLDGSITSYLNSLKHAVTRYRIELHAMETRLVRPGQSYASSPPVAPLAWFAIDKTSDLPLTAPARKLMKMLSHHAD